MKKSAEITLSAIMAALAAAFMITSLFPYLTYAISAFASLFIMIVVVEVGVKWGFASYIVASLLMMILPSDPEAKLVFIAITGYYPALKAIIEKRFSRVVEYILKFFVFNGAIFVSYGVFAGILGIDMRDMGDFGKYTAVVLVVLANFVFFLYDRLIAKMSVLYYLRLHKAVNKIFKKK